VSTARALLVIADIGGYTRFMRLHRMSLAHAQENTLRLLDAVIGAEPRLQLVAIEGDAAFLYLPAPDADDVTRSLGGLAREMHRAFHAEQQELQALTVCHCDACAQTGDLSVKIVAHVGEVAEQDVRGRVSLAGVDVILVHRMLKNSVPVPEYVLMTETAYNACEPFVREHGTEIEEELEGLGTERLWFVDIGHIAAEPEPVSQPTKSQRAAHATSLTLRSLPYYVGLKRSRVTVAD
jgi:Protein of unknown function (DUF2652)